MKTKDIKRTEWFHGSPERIQILRMGSWVSPYKEVAKAFSHKPTIISSNNDYSLVKHNGKLLGYLYLISEIIEDDDLEELSGTDKTHWKTIRDLKVELITEVPILKEELVPIELEEKLKSKYKGIGFWKT